MDRRFLFLIALSKVSADAVAKISKDHSVTVGVQDRTCESQLDTVKKQLQKLDEAAKNQTVLATLQLDEAPAASGGVPHWPEDRGAYLPPIVVYCKELTTWMSTVQNQWVVAFVALAFGLICVFNGPASFRTIMIWGIALVAAASAKYEFELVWPDLTVTQKAGIAIETGLVAALIIYKSFEGLKVILGALLGLLIGLELDSVAHTEFWPLNASLAYYSAWGFVGILAMTVMQKRIMAVFAPLLGGMLCASAIGYLTMDWVWTIQRAGTSTPSWVEIRGDCWLDFVSQLLGRTENAGVIKIQDTKGFPVSSIDFDRLGGRLLWLIFFWYGMKRQWRKAKEGPSYFSTTLGSSYKDPLLSSKVRAYEP